MGLCLLAKWGPSHHDWVNVLRQMWCFLQLKTTRILTGSVFTLSKHPQNGPQGARIDLTASFTTFNRKWPKIAFSIAYKLTSGLEMSSLSGRDDVNLFQFVNILGRRGCLKLSPEALVPASGTSLATIKLGFKPLLLFAMRWEPGIGQLERFLSELNTFSWV